MTEKTDNFYKLRLEDDKLVLGVSKESKTPEIKIDVPVIAILDNKGVLRVTDKAGFISEYYPVTPDETMPLRCNKLMYFGLESQIVIFRHENLKRYFKLETSHPDFFTVKREPPIPPQFSAILPRDGRDAIVLEFSDKKTTVLLGQPSDMNRFLKLLDQPVIGHTVFHVYPDPLKFRVTE